MALPTLVTDEGEARTRRVLRRPLTSADAVARVRWVRALVARPLRASRRAAAAPLLLPQGRGVVRLPRLRNREAVQGVRRAVRVVAAIVLVLLGCGAALIAWGPLQNLFGYRDSPVSTYLLFGLPWLVLAGAAFAVAWRLITR